MKVIGLTGTVGSGKSTIGKLLQEGFFAKLVMTDELGHLAMAKGGTGYERIIEEFGTEILGLGGEIDRARLGAIVFHDTKKLERLNAIIHPWVKHYLAKDMEQERQAGQYRYYVIESAILFDTGLDGFCDETWVVDANDWIRAERLRQARGYSEEKTAAILANQQSREYLFAHCGQVIENSGSLEEAREQIKKLLV